MCIRDSAPVLPQKGADTLLTLGCFGLVQPKRRFYRPQDLSLIHICKLTYIRCGDYDIPNLKLSEQPETSIGKYGRMRKSYLKEHRPNL